jgi:hypothetical protein
MVVNLVEDDFPLLQQRVVHRACFEAGLERAHARVDAGQLLVEQHGVKQHQRGDLAHGGCLFGLIRIHGAGVNAERLGEARVRHLHRVDGLREQVDALLEMLDGGAHLVFGGERLVGVLECGRERVQVACAPVGGVSGMGGAHRLKRSGVVRSASASWLTGNSRSEAG